MLTIKNLKNFSYLNLYKIKSKEVELDRLGLSSIDIGELNTDSLRLSEMKISDYLQINSSTVKNMEIISSSVERSFDFSKITILEDIKCNLLSKSNLNLKNCSFSGKTEFSNNNFKDIRLIGTDFKGTTYFQNVSTDELSIDKTDFSGETFFEGFDIVSLNSTNRYSLNTLKKLLEKSGNKIDSDRLRSAELVAYKNELEQKIRKKREVNKDLSDYIILYVGAFFSKNGNSWSQAILRTFLGAFLFYSLIFIIFFSSNEFSFTLESINSFFASFFRFLTVPSFENPFAPKKEYFTNSICFVLLIFGKIYIAIGLYETITAFRKFKK